MAGNVVSVSAFLQLNDTCFDVRSPLEYAQGHIPGSINIPIFDDHERSIVGAGKLYILRIFFLFINALLY
jgi:tRNA 2-selenouridine synthase SelU